MDAIDLNSPAAVVDLTEAQRPPENAPRSRGKRRASPSESSKSSKRTNSGQAEFEQLSTRFREIMGMIPQALSGSGSSVGNHRMAQTPSAVDPVEAVGDIINALRVELNL